MINSITLKNFKCFDYQKVNLSSLSLLTGVNGMGKSSLLQSILLLRQSYEHDLFPKKGISLNGDYINFGLSGDILYQDANEDHIGIHVNYNKNQTEKFDFNYIPNEEVLYFSKKPREETGDFYKLPISSDEFQYLGAERIGPRPSFQISDYKVRHHKRLGISGELAAYYLAVFGEYPIPSERLIHPKFQASNSLKFQTEAWIKEISPGTRINVTEHPKMNAVNLTYQFDRGAELSKEFRSINVGFGITYTLPVVIALLSAKPGSLLLLENPEAHLHPKGQAKLGELMAICSSTGVQIIVESHSDHLLNGIRIAVKKEKISTEKTSINFFTSDEENAKRIKIFFPKMQKDGRLDSWPDDFFDEWDKSLDQLL